MNYSQKDFVSNSTTPKSANKTYNHISDHNAQIRKRQTTGAFDVKNNIYEKDTTKVRGR